jgi:hypothetical protein
MSIVGEKREIEKWECARKYDGEKMGCGSLSRGLKLESVTDGRCTSSADPRLSDAFVLRRLVA